MKVCSFETVKFILQYAIGTLLCTVRSHEGSHQQVLVSLGFFFLTLTNVPVQQLFKILKQKLYNCNRKKYILQLSLSNIVLRKYFIAANISKTFNIIINCAYMFCYSTIFPWQHFLLSAQICKTLIPTCLVVLESSVARPNGCGNWLTPDHHHFTW